MCNNTLPKQVFIICIAGSVLFASQALAVAQGWAKLNGPYGCYVADIVANPLSPQILYMATDVGGAYKSLDGGLNWIPINNGLENALGGWFIAMDPTNPQTLFYGSWVTGLYRSTDGGKSWLPSLVETPCLSPVDFASSPDGSTMFCAVEQGCFYKSTDRGVTWRWITNGWSPRVCHYSVAVNQLDPNIVYTAFRCENGTYYLYKSTDNGESWVDKSTGLDTFAPITEIKIHPTDPNIIYLATEDGVYKTTDAAEHWAKASNGLACNYTRDIAIYPSKPNIVLVATWNGLYATSDGGSNWINGGSDFSSQCVKTVDMSTASTHAYAGVWGGVYGASSLGSPTDDWTFNSNGLTQDVHVGKSNLAVTPTDPPTIYAGTYGGGVAKSTDGGATFNYVNNGINMGYCNGIFPAPDDANFLFCFTKGGDICYKTTNAGASWTISNSGLPNNNHLSGVFDPIDPDIFYVATEGGVYKTTDRGTSWLPANSGLTDLYIQFITVDPSNPTTVYAATQDSGFFKSINSGGSWTAINNGITNLKGRSVAVSPVDPLTLYAGTKTGVFKSTDGGASWVESSTGIAGKEVRKILVHPLRPLTVYAITRSAGAFISDDGGVNWSPSNRGLESLYGTDINFDDPTNPTNLYIATGIGVYVHDAASLVGAEEESYPDDMTLLASSPNPFSSRANIRYTLPLEGPVTLTVYDALGQRIKTLVNESKQPGHYSVSWNGSDEQGNTAPAGVYFVRLTASSRVSTLRMILTP